MLAFPSTCICITLDLQPRGRGPFHSEGRQCSPTPLTVSSVFAGRVNRDCKQRNKSSRTKAERTIEQSCVFSLREWLGCCVCRGSFEHTPDDIVHPGASQSALRRLLLQAVPPIRSFWSSTCTTGYVFHGTTTVTRRQILL